MSCAGARRNTASPPPVSVADRESRSLWRAWRSRNAHTPAEALRGYRRRSAGLAARNCREAGMEIRHVGVLGCGLMGSGIAQVSAMAGFDVTVLEVEQRFLDKGFAGIEKSLVKFAEKGALQEKPDAVRARLQGATRKEDLAGCDIIIEAIIENLADKRK